jgi:hypothetical protein
MFAAGGGGGGDPKTFNSVLGERPDDLIDFAQINSRNTGIKPVAVLAPV